MSTTLLPLEDLIENPSATGPVRAVFVTPSTEKIDQSLATEFDSLEEAAVSFHAFGSNCRLNDPDGVTGIVWIGDETTPAELELRFDGNGMVFFEN